MNRRSLIFVVALTLALFFINQWFGSKDRERKSSSVQKQEGTGFPTNEELLKKIAPISSLPIVPLSLDPSGSKIEAFGVKVDDQYLVLSWAKTLPTEIYTNKQKLLLRIPPGQIGSPALYSSNMQLPLRIAQLPEVGSADLQLLYFTEARTHPEVTLAEYKDNDVFFPIKEPGKPAIALLNVKGEYLPAGIYSPSKISLERLETFPNFGAIISAKSFTLSSAETEATTGTAERFYVLENEFQQLVFSNFGAAVAEINLPFRSDKNPNSVIEKIGFDRIMQKKYPENDYFPGKPNFQILNSQGNPQTVEKGVSGGYYPLLRRNVIGPSKHVMLHVPPHYYTCNTVSEDPETATLVYTLRRFEKNLIEFEATQSKRRIIKTFSLPEDPSTAPYCFNLSIRIEGDNRNLFLTSGVPEVELISDNWTPSLKYRMKKNNKPQIEQLDLPKTATTYSSITPDWISNSNGFFGVILDPLTNIGPGFTSFFIPGDVAPTRISIIDSQYDLYPLQKYPGYELHLPLHLKSQTANFRIFAGPFAEKILKTVDLHYSNPSENYYPDYIATQSFHGWFAFISEPFAKFLFILMKFFHLITKSWGISIILLTIALRIMLYPLNAWSIKSSSRMQQVAPQVSAIQQKYKKDPKRAQMEIMTLYKEKGVNPLTGCLPLLIQMPFLIGMFDLLKSTFDLRGATFIPGWIDNLTAPDVLFTWNYPIIFFGTQFHLLPIILGIVMFIQQKFSSTAPKDPKLMTDQQKQQRTMGNILAIVFTVMFYHFPSGLNIYWLSSMLLGIVQQWYMTKKK